MCPTWHEAAYNQQSIKFTLHIKGLCHVYFSCAVICWTVAADIDIGRPELSTDTGVNRKR